MSVTSATAARRRAAESKPTSPPVLFVIDDDTRFNVPFRFHDASSKEGRRLLQGKGLGESRLPVMVRHDGRTMVQPTLAQIIEATGGRWTARHSPSRRRYPASSR